MLKNEPPFDGTFPAAGTFEFTYEDVPGVAGVVVATAAHPPVDIDVVPALFRTAIRPAFAVLACSSFPITINMVKEMHASTRLRILLAICICRGALDFAEGPGEGSCRILNRC